MNWEACTLLCTGYAVHCTLYIVYPYTCSAYYVMQWEYELRGLYNIHCIHCLHCLHCLHWLHCLHYSPWDVYIVYIVTVYIVQIPEYERAVVFGSTLDMAFVRGPGLIFVLPFLEKVIVVVNNIFIISRSWSSWSSSSVQIRKIDTRTSYYEIPPQQILSTDSVTLTVDAVRLLLMMMRMMSTMTTKMMIVRRSTMMLMIMIMMILITREFEGDVNTLQWWWRQRWCQWW